jgi:hypothetical protein
LPTSSPILIDDRLLIAVLLDEPLGLPAGGTLHTTAYWYYRACRAAVTGGAGQLSGPFRSVNPDQQAAAITAILALPDDIGLPDARLLVPLMVDIHQRHPHLNLMNLEAAATARLLAAQVLLSPPAADGVLPPALDAEHLPWAVIHPGG